MGTACISKGVHVEGDRGRGTLKGMKSEGHLQSLQAPDSPRQGVGGRAKHVDPSPRL